MILFEPARSMDVGRAFFFDAEYAIHRREYSFRSNSPSKKGRIWLVCALEDGLALFHPLTSQARPHRPAIDHRHRAGGRRFWQDGVFYVNPQEYMGLNLAQLNVARSGPLTDSVPETAARYVLQGGIPVDILTGARRILLDWMEKE